MNDKSDDDDHSGESSTPGNSRPGTPNVGRLREVGLNNLVYQVNRDTLINEPNENHQTNESVPTLSSAKRPPPPAIPPVVPPPIPVRHHVNDNTTVMNNSNENSRKPADQPPELPPKTNRALAVGAKILPVTNPILPPVKTNPTVNKENQNGATAETEDPSPSHEGKLVQRHKSRTARRKMTEEEAIKELGSYIN